VSEKLDYTPGVFTIERHIPGKRVCQSCEMITQAPVPAYSIDTGIPTASLLTQVLIAKYLAHALRKFHELWINHENTVAEEALKNCGALYDIEREVKDLMPDERKTWRRINAKPIAAGRSN
jgi:uncharacterized protein YbaR (Trm112 family)